MRRDITAANVSTCYASLQFFSCVVAEMLNVVSDNGAGAGESGAEWEELGRIDRSNIGGRQRWV